MTAHKLITAPASEPVTLSEAKLHVRQDIDTDDTLITAQITTAREEVERISCHALLTQTWEMVLDCWPTGDEIRLPRPPLQSVTSVKVTDTAGVETTWDAANYIVDTDSVPGRIVLAYGMNWPSTNLKPVGGIRIRYVSGWTSAGVVPQSFKQAMLLLVGHWYETREGVGDTVTQKAGIAFGVESLMRSYRMKAMPR